MTDEFEKYATAPLSQAGGLQLEQRTEIVIEGTPLLTGVLDQGDPAILAALVGDRSQSEPSMSAEDAGDHRRPWL